MSQSPEGQDTTVKSHQQQSFFSKWFCVITTSTLLSGMKNLLLMVKQGIVFTVKERITGVTSVKRIRLLRQERKKSKETALFV